MPDFTVIEGRGRGRSRDDFHDNNARYHLRRLIIEILRGLARGDDLEQRIKTQLHAFLERVDVSATPMEQIILTVLIDMHKDLTNLNTQRRQRAWRSDIGQIVLASLRLAAETCSSDDAAKGRASSRRSDLDTTIEEYVIGREESSREYGSSYLLRLLDQHFPKRPKPMPPRRRKPRRQPRLDD
jgi:hypothetical protein